MTQDRKENKTAKVASIVLAGGQGTRLKPLTSHKCKPAVSFAGRFRLIDVPISSSLNSNIEKIFIITQHLASTLESHINDTYNKEGKELTIFSPCSGEKEHPILFNGTADAVRKNWQSLKETDVEYFLILSGDQLYNIAFEDMIDCAKKKDADLLIATLRVEQAEAKRMGLLLVDATCGVQDFVEKPQDPALLQRFALHSTDTQPSQYLGSMGIYIFKKEALAELLQNTGDDFGHDLIPLQVKKGKTFAYVYDGYWEDIGTVGAFYRANLALTEDEKGHLNLFDEKNPIIQNSKRFNEPLIKESILSRALISPGSIIEAKYIQHSVIGLNTTIDQGTVIEDSVILGNQDYKQGGSLLSIGKNCTIKKAIIDENTYIGNNVQLINQAGLREYDGDGIYIRDGIIVVTSGTTVPDGFTL